MCSNFVPDKVNILCCLHIVHLHSPRYITNDVTHQIDQRVVVVVVVELVKHLTTKTSRNCTCSGNIKHVTRQASTGFHHH